MLRHRLVVALLVSACSGSSGVTDAGRGEVPADVGAADTGADFGASDAGPPCANLGAVADGMPCIFNADCCSGVCNIGGRHLVGVCQFDDGRSSGACLDGTTITGDGSQCCSGVSNGACTGPSGVAPHATCRASPYACRSSTDCCTHNCITDMTDGFMYCGSAL